MPLKTSDPSETSQSICTRTFRNLTEYLHPNPPEPHRLCAPKPSGTSPGTRTSFWNLTEYLHQVSEVSPGICTETLQNLTRYLHLEPSGTSTGICTGTLQNLTRYLHRNPRTSTSICTEILQNVTRYLHQNPLEPQPHHVSAPEPSKTSSGTCT